MGNDRSKVLRYAWLSLAAALATIGLKAGAYLLTGSVGLLSDALESGVNLVGAVTLMVMLRVALQPPDETHAYGHEKAEYFASGLEGLLIIGAAVSIAYTAWHRLLDPVPLQRVGWGLAVSTLAGVVNLVVARILLRAGKENHSIALEADGAHLMTDVWTSAGVILGVGVVALTGWTRLDPIIAMAVAAHILWEGWKLVRRTVHGFMDAAISEGELDAVQEVLTRYRGQGIEFHALRTRRSGARRFVSMHMLVPGQWTVHRAHTLAESVEKDIRSSVPRVVVFIHIEPLEDEASWRDQCLDRDKACREFEKKDEGEGMKDEG